MSYARNRYYHPTLAKWLARDPITYADGWNLYQYVQSKPTMSVDPNGTYYWKLFTWGLAAGNACIASFELGKCIQCIADEDRLLSNAAKKMPALQFYTYRTTILNAHGCASICQAAGIDGLKAAASFAARWAKFRVG